jgi:tetraprenyl-beta-curcumene synthase
VLIRVDGQMRRMGTVTGLTRQSAALARSTGRELFWGLRGVSREVHRWRELAAAIPDARLRADALRALERKRGNINGAALFWTLPDRRNEDLLGVLVAYEVLADYLDCVSERGAARGIENGRQLHIALVDALAPGTEMSDYYRHHDSGEDGGYVQALIEHCRTACERLPSYRSMQPLIARAAGQSAVLGLNHEPDPARRERALREWAELQWPEQTTGQSWFERTAGASAWLTVLAMLALAAEPRRGAGEARQTYSTYLQWIAPAGAMLDSYGDIDEDLASGDHSYIAHYPSRKLAVERVSELVRRSRSEARVLPDGARHSVIAACMIAFYLSKDSTRTPALRASTRELRRAGGPLVDLLLPVLRLWRTAYGQCTA